MVALKSNTKIKADEISKAILRIERLFKVSHLTTKRAVPVNYFKEFDPKKVEPLFREIAHSLESIRLNNISRDILLLLRSFPSLEYYLPLMDNKTRLALFRITVASQEFKRLVRNRTWLPILKSYEVSSYAGLKIKPSQKGGTSDKVLIHSARPKPQSHRWRDDAQYAEPKKKITPRHSRPKSSSRYPPSHSLGRFLAEKPKSSKAKTSKAKKSYALSTQGVEYGHDYGARPAKGPRISKDKKSSTQRFARAKVSTKSKTKKLHKKMEHPQWRELRGIPPSRDKQTADATFERYPQASFPENVELGKVEKLEVKIVVARPKTSVPPLTLTFNKGAKSVIVQVTLSTDSHFMSIENKHEAVISAPTTEEDSEPVTFYLEAIMEGKSEIRLQFWQEGSYLGQMTLISTVYSSSNKPSPQVPSNVTIPIRGENYQPSAVLPPPDLTISVERLDASEQYTVGLIRGREDPKYYRKLGTTLTSEDHINTILSDLNNPQIQPEQIDAAMVNAGNDLYKAIFEEGGDLRKAYVETVKQGIKSVVIHSDEPYIPWEIVRQHGDDIPEGFLCELYSITRWRPPHGLKPRTDAIKKADIVFPKTDLEEAAKEKELIETLLKGYGIAPNILSTVHIIFYKLKSGDFDMMHFASHGNFDNISGVSIPVEGGFISPSTVTLGKLNQPFIFMNACSTGRQTIKYSRINGWATKFIDNGASVFIGTLWPVDETRAKDFAESFYNNLKEGIAIGEAVKTARMLSKRDHDVAHLAYVVYSQPSLVIKFEN